jgi:phosphocarrier protein HPr
MRSARLDIHNPTGLHTRPATAFVRLAKTFACEISIRKGDKAANAKSLVKLLKIGISPGDAIELTCEGTDEEQALASLTQYIQDLTE